ncbi:crotonyl-CoA carboxylase/reductase [Salinispora tropica]|uniref:crotonyl-CoA carboxylase/reductase n=1 Tax=Salinispora tropica TaxID=168695 RepID=UPI00048A9357|nr:crotonyl-CoA carboxylase/reductase [Salinispora tropica]
MGQLTDAVLSNATAAEIAAAPLPEEYFAAHLRVEDATMFEGVVDKDVRKSLRLGHVPMPELAPDEVLVAVMASAVNYNTVWSAMFEPMSSFRYLKGLARQGGWAKRHDQPFHVVGSDCAGVIVRTGSGVRRWEIGQHVVVSPAYVDDQEPTTHADGMLGGDQKAWGFETNFGALAEFTVVRATQLIPKPTHLTWEEAASVPLCAGTAYRMLVSERGANMKQGDVVLVWGAAGGLGGYAVQYVRNGGGIPVAVVGSERKAEAMRRLGCEVILNRTEIGITDEIADDPKQVIRAGVRLGEMINEQVGRAPDIVFEHIGRPTFGISVFVAQRGGTVVTCGSSAGYQHSFDNRYLWMRLKRIIGSHIANLQEYWDAHRLFELGHIVPTMSAVYPLTDVAAACRLVQANQQIGKIAVRCLAPRAGLGVTNPELRERIGEDRLNPWRGLTTGSDGAEFGGQRDDPA